MSTQLKITDAQGKVTTVTIDAQKTVDVPPGAKVEVVGGSVSSSKTQGGSLVMQVGGQTVTLKGFVTAAASTHPPTLVVPGQVTVRVQNADGSVGVKVVSAGEALGASPSAKLTVLGAGAGVNVSQANGHLVLSNDAGVTFDLGQPSQLTPLASTVTSTTSTVSPTANSPLSATSATTTWGEAVTAMRVGADAPSASQTSTAPFVPTAPPPPTNVGATVALNTIPQVAAPNQQRTSESGAAVVPSAPTPSTSSGSNSTSSPAPATSGNTSTGTTTTPTVTAPPKTSSGGGSAASVTIQGFSADGHVGAVGHSATAAVVGTARAGATVELYLAGGAKVGSAVADAAGAWSITPTSALPAGIQTLTAKAFSGGSLIATSAGFSATLDIATPMPTVDGVSNAGRLSAFSPVAKPTLAGSGVPGGQIDVRVDGASVGKATIGLDGRWSLAAPNALADGHHLVTAVAVGPGASGYVSQTSVPTVVKVDLSGSAIATPLITGLTAATDTGTSATDGLTAVAKPSVTGTGTANTSVRILLDDKLAGEVPVGADGKWVYTFKDALAASAHAVKAVAVDATGAVGTTSTPFAVTIAQALTTPDEGFKNEVTYASGTTKVVASGILKNAVAVKVTIDGKAMPVTYDTQTITVADVGGFKDVTQTTWKAELASDLHTGAHKQVVTYTDANGSVLDRVETVNTSSSAIRPTVVGLTAASDTGLSNHDNITNATSGAVVTGYGQPGDAITVMVNGQRAGDTTVGANGVWTLGVGPNLPLNNVAAAVTAISKHAASTADASAPVMITNGSYDERNSGSTPGRITHIGRFDEMTASNYDPYTDPRNPLSHGPIPTGDGTISDTPALPVAPRPLLSGTGIPNSMVRIFVQDTHQNILYADGEVGVDASGHWSYNIQKELPLDKDVNITAHYYNPALHGPTGYDAAGYFGAFLVHATRTGLSQADTNTSPNPILNVVATNTFDPTRMSQGAGSWEDSRKTYPDALFVFDSDPENKTEHFYQSGNNTMTLSFGLPGVRTIDGGLFKNSQLPARGSVQVNADGSWTYEKQAYADGIYNFLMISTPEQSLKDKLKSIFSSDAGFTDFMGKFADNFFSAKPAVKLYDDLGNYVNGTIDSCASVKAVNPNNPIDALEAVNECKDALKGGYDRIKKIYDLTQKAEMTSKIAGGAQTLATIWVTNSFDLTMQDLDKDFRRKNPVGVAVRGLIVEHGDFSTSNAYIQLAADGKSFTTEIHARHPGELWGDNVGLKATAEIFMDGKLIAVRAVGSASEAPVSHVINVPAGTTHTFQVALTDLAGNRVFLPAQTLITGGNTNDGTTAFSGNVAAATPIVAPFIAGLSDVDTANGAVSHATPNARPVIRGVGMPGATLQIKIDGDVPAGSTRNTGTFNNGGAGATRDFYETVTVGADGTWAYAVPSALSNGTHTIEATAFVRTDASYGVYRSSPATTTTIVVDQASYGSPTISGLTGTGVAGANASVMRPSIGGTAPSNVVRVDLYVDGVLDSTVLDVKNGAWTAHVAKPLADGSHQVTAIGYASSGKATPLSAALPIAVSAQAVKAPTIAPLETNAPAPTIKGTADAWTTVTVYVDGVEVGQAKGGNWQFAMPTSLADGAHVVTAVATDAFGKKSAVTAPVALVVDTALVPAVPFALTPAHDTSLAHTGWLTRYDRPVLTGTAKPDSVVTVAIDGQVAGQATVNGYGTWSFTSPALSNGAHAVTVVAIDRAGNASAPAPAQTLVVDASAPVAPVVYGVVELAGDAGFALQGAAAPGVSVHVRIGSVDVGDFTANAAGRWSAPLDARPAGGAAVVVEATSAAGVKGASANFAVPTLDAGVSIALAGDVLQSPGIADGFTNVTAPKLTGKAGAGRAVDLYLDGAKLGSVAASAQGVWALTLPTHLADGAHTLRVVSDGKSSSVIVLTIDTGAPTVTVNGLAAGTDTGASAADDLTTSTTPTVFGTAEPGATVTLRVDGQAVGTTLAGFDGAWRFPLTGALAGGTHSFTATAVDRAGNSGASLTGVSVVDGVVPAAPVVMGLSAATDAGFNQADGITNNTRPTVVGTAAPGAIVTVYVGTQAVGATQADATGAWALPLSQALPNGSASLTARATDFAGNPGLASAAKTITIQTAALGTMTIESVLTDANDQTSNLYGHAPAGATVQVLIDGVPYTTTTALGDGGWTTTLPATIQPKDHAIAVRLTDAAGNVGPTAGWGYNPPIVTGVTADTDTSTAGNGGTTTNVTPTLTGTGPASSVLQISVDNVVAGTVTTDAAGQWTLPITTALTAGTHTVKADVLDGQGDVASSSAATSVVIETGAVKPRFTVSFGDFDAGGTFASRSFEGTSAANAAVVIKFDGVIIAQGVAGSDGHFSIPAAPALKSTPGNHRVVIEATSPGGLKAVSDYATATRGGNGTSVSGVVDGGLSDVLVTGARPQFRGGAAAFGAIKVFVDNVEYGTGSYSNGMWIMDGPGAALAPGAHSVRIEIRNPSNNTLSDSDTRSFTVDAAVPAAPTLGWPFVGPAVSAAPNGHPTVTGQAAAGAFVTVYVDGTAIGNATAGADGAFALTPAAPIAAGTHQITTRAVLPTGGMSDLSAPVPLIVSTSLAAPTLTGTDPQPLVAPTDGSLLVPTDSPSLLGTAAPGATVRVFVDGRSLGLAIADSSGAWRYAMPVKLAEGSHQVSITAYDQAGNESAPVTKALVVDVDALQADVSGVGAGVNGAQWALTGTAEASAQVLITVDGVAVGATRASATGAWAYDVSAYVGDTPHTLLATVVNASGASNPVGSARTVRASSQVAVSGLSSATDLGASSTDDLTSTQKPVLEGQALPGAVVQVVIDGVTVGTTTTNSDGQWAYAVVAPLAEGAHAVKAIATDAAGNIAISPAAATITVDMTGPVGPTVTHLAVVNGSQTINGTTEPGATVEVFVAGVSVGTALADASGAWSRAIATPIAATPTDVTARATDVSGTLGVVSAPVALSTRPAALGVHPDSDTGLVKTDNLTNLASPVLRGTGVAGAKVEVFVDGVDQGMAPVDAGGRWTFTPASPLTHASHTVAAAPIDGGRVGTPTAAAPFVVDLVGPAITATLADHLDPASTATTFITNQNRVNLTGTGEVGSTVDLFYANGGLVDSSTKLTIGAGGTWAITTSNINRSTNNVVEPLILKTTDPAGNVTEYPFTIDFRLSVTAPTFEGTTPTSYDPYNVIRGKAGPNDTVRVAIDGGPAATVETEADGSWHYTPATPLGTGPHAITAQGVDSFGKTSTVSAATVNVDLTPTAITPQDALTDGVSIANNFGIAVGGLIPNGHLKVTITRPDGSVAGEWDQTVPASGQLTYTTPLFGANGDYTYTAIAYDTNGVARPAGTFVVNGQAVFNTTTTIVVDGGGALVAHASPVVSGQTSNHDNIANATVKVVVQGGGTYTGTVNADGTWSVPVTEALVDGHHSVNVSFVSSYGKVDTTGGSTGFLQGFDVATTYHGEAPTFGVEHYAPLPATDFFGSPRVDAGSATVVEWGGQNSGLGASLSGSALGRVDDVIQLQVDGVDVGAPTSASSFSGRAWPAMSDGLHTVTAVAIDKAGNRSAPSAGLLVHKDSTVPVTTIDPLAAALDTGTSSTDGVTNVRTLTFTGHTKAGSLVTIVTDQGNMGTVMADASGVFTYTTSAQAHGGHTLRAIALSPGRVLGDTSATYTYTVDLLAPDATAFTAVTPNDHGLIGVAAPVLHGTAEKGAVVTLKTGAGTFVADVTVQADGTWSYPLAGLAEGTHTYTATIQDAAGNENLTASSTTFTVDLSAPSAATAVGLGLGSDTGLDTHDNRTNTPTVTLAGAAEPWSVVEVFVDNVSRGSAPAGENGLWSLPGVALGAQGSHSVTTTVTDRFGRAGGTTAALVVTLDTDAPTVPGAPVLAVGSDSGDPADHLTNVSRPTVGGTVEADALVTVLVDGVARGTVQTDASGVWSHQLATALTPGAHAITTTTTDVAGNVTAESAPLSLTVDTSGPALVIGGLADPTGASATNALTGTAKEGSLVIVTVAGQTLPGVTVLADGHWSAPFGPLDVGTHTFDVVATDAAGTTRTSATTATFAAPGQAAITAGGHVAPTQDTSAELAGTAPAGTVVRLYDGSTLLDTVTPTNGAWTYTATNLGHGSHGFRAVAVDAAGHVSADSAVITYNVDLQAPGVPVITGLLDPSASLAFGFTNAVIGTAEVGATVVVTLDDRAPVTVVATDGTWSIPVDSASLALGSHTVTARATDAAGNQGALATNAAITVAAPNPPTLDGAGTFTPIARANEVTLSGTAPTVPGGSTRVEIYDGATHVATTDTHSGVGGVWTVAVPMTHGSHSFTAVTIDDAGHQSAASTARVIEVDLQGPAAPVVGAFDAPLTYGADNVLRGTAEADSTLVVTYGNATYDVTTNASGEWALNIPGSANYYGAHAVSIVATDPLGNESAPYTYPAITVPLPPGGTFDGPATYAASTNRQPTFSGDAPAGALVFIMVDGTSTDYGYTYANSLGRWSMQLERPLPHGATTFGLKISIPGSPELLGAQSTIVYNVDIEGPAASVPVLADPTAFGVIENALTGAAEVGSTVTVTLDNGTPHTFVIDNAGAWSLPVASSSLATGTHTVTTTITDALGNVGAPGSLTFTVDAPAAPTITGENTTVVSTVKTATVSGTGIEGTTVHLYDNGGATPVGTDVVGADGTWSVSLSNLDEGAHTFTATATDPATHVSGGSAPRAISVDSIAPDQPTVDALPTAATQATMPALSGQAEKGSTVTVFDGTDAIATAHADAATGDWHVTLTAPLGDGPHTLTAKATDAAGNTSVASDGVSYLVDLTPPAQPTLATTAAPGDLHPTFTGTADVGTDLQIMLDGVVVDTLTNLTDPTFSYAFPDGLGQGAQTVSVRSRDAAGNVSAPSAGIAFDIDTEAPIVPYFTFLEHPGLTPPLVHEWLTDMARPTFNAIAEAGSTITIRDENGDVMTVLDRNGVAQTTLHAGTESVTGSVVFTPTVDFSPGEHWISITSEDAHGNTSSGGTDFTVRLPDESPTIGYLVHDAYTSTNTFTTSGTHPTFQGTAAQRAVVKILVDGAPVAEVTADDEGHWTYQSEAAISNGGHTLQADLVVGGVAAGHPVGSSFTVNTNVPPSISDVVLTSADSAVVGGLLHVNNHPTVTGRSVPGATIHIWGSSGAVGPINAEYTDSVVVGADGAWSYTFTEPLAVGFNVVMVEAKNQYGQSFTDRQQFTVDPVAGLTPDAPTIDPLSDHPENGVVLDGFVTSAAAVKLSGTAKAGATVQIFELYSAADTALLATAVADGNGVWTIDGLTLPAGSDHQYVAIASKDGQKGYASDVVKLEADNTAPVPDFKDFSVPDAGVVTLGAGVLKATESNDRGRVHTVVSATTANGTFFLDANHDDAMDAGEALVAGAVFTTAQAADLKYMAANTGSARLELSVADALGNVASGTYSVGVDNDAPTLAVTNLVAGHVAVPLNGDQGFDFSYVDAGDWSKVKVKVVSVTSNSFYYNNFYLDANGVDGYQPGEGDVGINYSDLNNPYSDLLTFADLQHLRFSNGGDARSESLTIRVTDGAGHSVDVTITADAVEPGPTPYHLALGAEHAPASTVWWNQPEIDLSHLVSQPPAQGRATVGASAVPETLTAHVEQHALEQALLTRVLGTQTTSGSQVWDHTAVVPAAEAHTVDFGSLVNPEHPNAYLELLSLSHVGQG